MTAFIDHCLPSQHCEGPRLRQARLMLVLLMLMTMVNVVSIAIQLSMGGGGWEWTALQWLLVYPATFTAFYRSRSLVVPVHLLTATIMISLAGLTLAFGGTHRPIGAMLMVVPLLPMVLINWRAGLGWAAVLLAFLAVGAFLGPMEPILQVPIPALERSVPPIMAFLVLIGTFVFTETSRDRAELHLHHTMADAERARAEAEAARAQAEAAMRARSEFLATMTHEIRTPMSGILSAAELLEAGTLTGSEREQVAIVRDAGEVLLHILDDILDVSRLEADKMELDHRPFELHDLIRRTVALMEPTAAEKQLALQLQQRGGDYWVAGDPSRLRQVVLNLLSNALKFTDSGRAGIRVSATPDHVELTVSDTGIGMSTTQLERVFEPFIQADGSASRRFGGTGLGLAITAKLVERMGGTITAASDVGAGSTFRVILPLEQVDSPSTDDADQAPPRWLPELRVLIAEDNPVNQVLLRALLGSLGITSIELASDGREAVTIAAERQLDVILMDMQMPGMDGPEATRRIRAGEAILSQAPVTIVAVTANVLPEDRETCLASGMDEFLPKPLRRESLVEVLARCTADPRTAIRAVSSVPTERAYTPQSKAS